MAGLFSRDGQPWGDSLLVGDERCEDSINTTTTTAKTGVFSTINELCSWQYSHASAKAGPFSACYMQGSFLPVPDLSIFGDSEGESISLGEVLTPEGEQLEINKGRPTLSLSVTNMGDRPIQVWGVAFWYCCYRRCVLERAEQQTPERF